MKIKFIAHARHLHFDSAIFRHGFVHFEAKSEKLCRRQRWLGDRERQAVSWDFTTTASTSSPFTVRAPCQTLAISALKTRVAPATHSSSLPDQAGRNARDDPPRLACLGLKLCPTLPKKPAFFKATKLQKKMTSQLKLVYIIVEAGGRIAGAYGHTAGVSGHIAGVSGRMRAWAGVLRAYCGRTAAASRGYCSCWPKVIWVAST